MLIWEITADPFNRLLSFGEAAEIWGLDQSTLRKAVTSKKLLENRDCRKFGKQWVVTAEAMCREYGRNPWANFSIRNHIPVTREDQGF